MRAGGLKYSLEVLTPIRETDRMGAERIEYESRGIIHAERKTARGNRSEEVGEHFPTYAAEFIVRDAHRIEENWRVRQLGGYLYTVVAIVPNLDKGFKVLECDRVNE